MAAEAYKKWIIFAVIVIVAGIVIFSVSTSQHKTETPTRGGAEKPAGPWTGDANTKMFDTSGVDMNDPSAVAGLGDRYFENQMYNQAIKTYEKALALNPKDVDTYNDMGLAQYYTRQPDAAIETLRKGTEIGPSYQRIWLSLGFILLSNGQTGEAASILEKARNINPDSEIGQEAQRMLGGIK